MVVFDATFLMLLVDPDAPGPLGEDGLPLPRCRERIDFLIKNLQERGEKIVIPTPALSEVLVGLRTSMQEILHSLTQTYAFKVVAFEERAAIEVAFLTDADLQKDKPLTPDERKAKVKYDRQIIAIAKVNGASHIYSDDENLCKKAKHNLIPASRLSDLPLPPEPPQASIQFPESRQ